MGQRSWSRRRVMVLAAAVALLGSKGWGCNGSSGSAPGAGFVLPSTLTIVAFQSDATNLVAGDANGLTDVFVRNITTNTTSFGPLSSSGTPLSNTSALAALTPDGRFMAWQYGGIDVIPGVTGFHVYVRDLLTGQVEASPTLAGRTAGGSPSISADGRIVTFTAFSTPGPGPGVPDIFAWDRVTSLIQWCSAAPGGTQGTGGNCFNSKVSGDGRFVAFESSMTDLLPGDTNGVTDAFVFDRVLQTLERVSLSSAGAQGNNLSERVSISGDGRFVAFHSYASNLVAGDSNNGPDVFVRDRQSGTTERVSVSSAGVQATPANSPGFGTTSISWDGRYVAFSHSGANLVAGDGNGALDVFVRDRTAGTTVRVSIATGGAEGNGASDYAAIFPGGRWVGFQSAATNLVAGDGNGVLDVFLHDLQTGATTRLSVSSAGVEGNANSLVPVPSSP